MVGHLHQPHPLLDIASKLYRLKDKIPPHGDIVSKKGSIYLSNKQQSRRLISACTICSLQKEPKRGFQLPFPLVSTTMRVALVRLSQTIMLRGAFNAPSKQTLFPARSRVRYYCKMITRQHHKEALVGNLSQGLD